MIKLFINQWSIERGYCSFLLYDGDATKVNSYWSINEQQLIIVESKRVIWGA